MRFKLEFKLKDPQFKKPKKYTVIDFDLKFEMVRRAPKMKQGCQVIKLSGNARVDQIKSENIEKLGEATELWIFRDEDHRYELTSDSEILT